MPIHRWNRHQAGLPKPMMKQQQNEGEDYRHETILMDVFGVLNSKALAIRRLHHATEVQFGCKLTLIETQTKGAKTWRAFSFIRLELHSFCRLINCFIKLICTTAPPPSDDKLHHISIIVSTKINFPSFDWLQKPRIIIEVSTLNSCVDGNYAIYCYCALSTSATTFNSDESTTKS